jgi:hypothetical protein
VHRWLKQNKLALAHQRCCVRAQRISYSVAPRKSFELQT